MAVYGRITVRSATVSPESRDPADSGLPQSFAQPAESGAR
jgi:hypothetical protein